MVPLPTDEQAGVASAVCGAVLTLTDVETVIPGEGMPCTLCVIHHVTGKPSAGSAERAGAGLAAGGATYQGWGWPVTRDRDQVRLSLHDDVSALAIPAPLGAAVAQILTHQRCVPAVLGHPYAPEHHVVLTGERYGVPLPWPAQVHQVTGVLLLPPTVTPRGPITWIQPPQQDSLRLCREIEFIPDSVWIKNPDHQPTLVPLHRDDDPERWLQLAYATGYDDAVVTQVDDGHPAGPGLGGAMPTSSASSPVIVAVMLAALDAHPGHRVLEIGTGTGYNAALLAHRLGAEHITSIEVDADIADQARTALTHTGYGNICAVTGDGALGYSPGAPYDRVIATAAVHRILYPWVEQTRPGGRILLPWANSYTGALVALTVDEHGGASGGIVGESLFMWLRGQRQRRGPVRDVVGRDEDRAQVHLTQLHPHLVVGEQSARFAIGQRVHRCQWRYRPFDAQAGVGVFWLLDFESRSWAKLTHSIPDASDGEFPVYQYGPRRLWDEVHAAHQWWVDQGKPHANRWHFTVTVEGQRIRLG